MAHRHGGPDVDVGCLPRNWTDEDVMSESILNAGFTDLVSAS